MIIAVFQVIASLIILGLLRIFSRLEMVGILNLRAVRKPVIIVANHESHLDPQLLGVVCLNRLGLLPLRYMAKDRFFRIPLFNLLIWLLGAFPARKKQGIERSLEIPLRLLRRGQSVIMFPEGRMVVERPKLGEGRRGAAMLALQTGAQILPLSLHTPYDLPPLPVSLKRHRIVINVGEPFRLPKGEFASENEATVFKATKLIMEKIAELYYQHRY